MKSRPYILKEVQYKTVKKTDYNVAVLPWGATEAHNYHLPYGTDVIETEYIAAEAARLAWEQGARVMVLPAVPFGVNTGQLDIPFDINMNPSTQAAVLYDVMVSLANQGIPKLMILNGHGGNDFKQMIRELQPRMPEMFLSTVSWFKILDMADYFSDTGEHAGEAETSILLRIVPELVLPLSDAGDGNAKAFRFKGMQEGWAWAQREWSYVTKDTGVGNPAQADADKGDRYLTDTIARIADYLVELDACKFDDWYE